MPPEVLLRAMLLQCLYSVRCERQLVGRLDTDLLFRWFCDLDPAVDVFDANGKAECAAALTMLDDLKQRQNITPKTLGADKGYDAGLWMIQLEQQQITPHIAMCSGDVGGKTPIHRRSPKDQQAIRARQRRACGMLMLDINGMC